MSRFTRRVGFSRLALLSAAVAAQLFAVGCDPGMLIQQVEAPVPAATGIPPQSLKLTVRTEHQLIGESFYAPRVDAINAGRSSIHVTKLELHTQSKSYDGDSLGPTGGKDWLTIEPGQTAAIGVLFHLDRDVWATFFRHPADLLIYYQDGSEPRVAHVTIVGTHLDGSR